MQKPAELDTWAIGQGPNATRLQMHGYGQNQIWNNFWLDGFCDVVPTQELQEKEGLKVEFQNSREPQFLKLKIAKFHLTKRYSNTTLMDQLQMKKNEEREKQLYNSTTNLDLAQLQQAVMMHQAQQFPGQPLQQPLPQSHLPQQTQIDPEQYMQLVQQHFMNY